MTIRTLRDIINHQSGSSWDGMHDRDIKVEFRNVESITVSNTYSGSGCEQVFTFADLGSQFEAARDSRYFDDFCREAVRKIPRVREVKDAAGRRLGLAFPETPEDAAAGMKRGLQREVALARPMTFKRKL